jgi:hypothetical protein
MVQVKTYSDWVIDGDYDWPPKCSSCEQILEDENTATTRLGCLHILHSSCLQSHLQSFPPHTAPAGYVCPTCSTSVWPPNKFFKDSESALYSRLKSVISETSVATTLLGSDISIQSTPTRDPPPAFAVGPLAEVAVPVTGSSEIELVVTSPSTTGVDAANGSNDLGVRHVNVGEGLVAQDASASTAQANGPGFGSLSSMMPATSAGAGTASVSTKSQESRFQKATAAAAVSATSSCWIVKDSLWYINSPSTVNLNSLGLRNHAAR